MHFFKNSYRSYLIKLPVLIIYLLFFAVQLFFNFDIAQKSVSAIHAGNHVQTGKSKQPVQVKQLNGKTSSNSKIRLNKRFQPSSIPCNFAAVMEGPVCYATTTEALLLSCDLYASVFLYTHSLRGPPVVA